MNAYVDSFMWDNALKNAFKNIFIHRIMLWYAIVQSREFFLITWKLLKIVGEDI